MELIKQQDNFDCGVANCVMIINHYQKNQTTVEDFKLTHNYQRQEYSLQDIKNKLSKHDITIEYYALDAITNIIDANSYPLLMVVKNAQGLNHYITINGYENNYFEIYDPSYKTKRKLTLKQLKLISLNIVGFLKHESKRDEKKTNAHFNRKYWQRFWLLFKESWVNFLVINLIGVISSFAFFFANMFIKVLLTEYAYLTIKRSILIVLMFVGIVTAWFILISIQKQLCRRNDQKCLHKYFSYLDNTFDLTRVNNSFEQHQQLKELSNLLSVAKQQLYLLNNFVGFSLFTTLVIILTSRVSLILLIGTLILMVVLFVLKVWQAKRNHSSLLINKLYGNQVNNFTNNLVTNFSALNQRINLKDYLELNKEHLIAPRVRDNSLIIYLEKISIYLYYFVMIFCLYATGLDISLFLVITNITFVFSHQLEAILTNLNSSFLVNRKLKIVNHLKPKVVIKSELKIKGQIIIKGSKVRGKVVRVQDLNDVLIDYQPLANYREAKQVFDTSYNLVQSETGSNNLFNFGKNSGLENYQKFKLAKWIEELGIDLSVQSFYLNEEQQEFIKLASCLFTMRKIILIKKQEYNWFLFLERDIKKYLKDRLVIIYE